MTYDPEAICPQCGIRGAHFPSTCLSIRFDRLKEEHAKALAEIEAAKVAALPNIEVKGFEGGARLEVNGYGIAWWNDTDSRNAKEYATEVARVLLLALKAGDERPAGQVEAAIARAARAEAIIERFSTWIDRVCGPIRLSDAVKKVDLIEGWDRARTPEFFAVMDAERAPK